MITISKPTNADLVEIEAHADQMGIFLDLHLDLDANNKPYIWLGELMRTSGEKGSGRRVLENLFAFADDHDLPIRAAVLCWNEALLEYYSDLGFEVIRDGTPHSLDDHSTIERRPH